MRNSDVRNVVRTYCSIAELKEMQHSVGNQIAATRIFGAQQLAVLYWAESGYEFDIQKVIVMIAFHANRMTQVPDSMRLYIEDYDANQVVEARLAHLFLGLEDVLHIECEEELNEAIKQVKLIKAKYYGDFNEAKITDDDYDKLCAELTQWRDSADLGIDVAELWDWMLAHPKFVIGNDDWNRILVRYCILSELKDKVRKGPIYWNVKVEHHEVVSEHAFGTQNIAWLMAAHEEFGLDLYKVIMMLAIHETEESVMPDFTPYDPVTPQRMLEMGTKAVKVVYGDLKKYEYLNSLLDDFNAKDTWEGMFAYRCDKLEFNFRIKKYSDLGLCTIEGGQPIVLNDPEIQRNIDRGAKTVADLIIMHEMPKFIGTNFESVARFLRIYDTTQ